MEKNTRNIDETITINVEHTNIMSSEDKSKKKIEKKKQKSLGYLKKEKTNKN